MDSHRRSHLRPDLRIFRVDALLPQSRHLDLIERRTRITARADRRRNAAIDPGNDVSRYHYFTASRCARRTHGCFCKPCAGSCKARSFDSRTGYSYAGSGTSGHGG